MKLIGIDLDGTLLTSDKAVSSHTKQILTEVMSLGHIVVPVTGRPFSGLPKEVLAIPGIQYAITSNGASTYCLQTHALLRKEHLSPELGLQILSENKDQDMIFECFVDGYGYITHDGYQKLITKYKDTSLLSYIQSSRKPVDNLHTLLSESKHDIEGFSIMCSSLRQRDALYDELKAFSCLNIVCPAPLNLELNHCNANKGQALLDLGRRLGIAPTDTIAFGDNDNDTAMLKQVALPIAMGNASEAIKSIASSITFDNDHDGVAHALKKLLLS